MWLLLCVMVSVPPLVRVIGKPCHDAVSLCEKKQNTAMVNMQKQKRTMVLRRKILNSDLEATAFFFLSFFLVTPQTQEVCSMCFCALFTLRTYLWNNPRMLPRWLNSLSAILQLYLKANLYIVVNGCVLFEAVVCMKVIGFGYIDHCTLCVCLSAVQVILNCVNSLSMCSFSVLFTVTGWT